MSHPVTHQMTFRQKLCHSHIYPRNATDFIPNIESRFKILPSVIHIIHYSFKHQVLLSQCDTLNVRISVVIIMSVVRACWWQIVRRADDTNECVVVVCILELSSELTAAMRQWDCMYRPIRATTVASDMNRDTWRWEDGTFQNYIARWH